MIVIPDNKTFFKHRFGFVNIDQETIYFTDSGNWKETENLLERNEVLNSKSKIKERVIKLLHIIISLVLITYTNYDNIDEINFMSFKTYIPPLIILTIALTSYFIQKRFINHSLNYKLPIRNIKRIQIGENKAEISFSDFKGEDAKHILLKISKNGIQQLNEIKTNHLLNQTKVFR